MPLKITIGDLKGLTKTHGTRAVAVNIEIMRAVVRLRQLLTSHADLARRLAALEKKYDGQFQIVFDAIRQLMAPPARRDGLASKQNKSLHPPAA